MKPWSKEPTPLIDKIDMSFVRPETVEAFAEVERRLRHAERFLQELIDSETWPDANRMEQIEQHLAAAKEEGE